MAFYTSLSGLNAAQLDLSVTSNNIANVGTTGFKQSRAEFGDLISSSALQSQSSSVGQGTRLKSISQDFTQGATQTTSRALDLMVGGEGFFVTRASGTGNVTKFTRNGAFSLNGNNDVVDSGGAVLQVLPVDSLGNVIATGSAAMQGLHVPPTSGTPKSTSAMSATLTFPSDADLPAQRTVYNSTTAPYAFNKNDSNSYNYATSITVYDAVGNALPATSYYIRTTKPAPDGSGDQTSAWTVHTYVGDKEVFPTGTTTAQQITFAADGTMTAPTASFTYDPVQPTGAAAPLTITMNYGSATKQGNYAFTTVKQDQNGNTTGKLNGLTVSEDGLVQAGYSDGTTSALGKVALATFANPNGLHQAGSTSWTTTGKSGNAQIGEASTDGRGQVNAGALEMSNVDLTAELVNLISAQRNFQANAKAIDTDKQMLQTIIQLQ
ncbi:flagellar hook protein FlgE [Sphingomonas morindae]|uniref:Flagellar hook protein FlgE n=1 Tax=Sphingomonas morindae TaxID=1541170 RepID=A0ABY4X9V9_9SPHN|nr:flagellar hook protein FlgE [Sphingomonas morindae]USI73738.1 flagellar hook protein FlgE [Sphingomonas morindae]